MLYYLVPWWFSHCTLKCSEHDLEYLILIPMRFVVQNTILQTVCVSIGSTYMLEFNTHAAWWHVVSLCVIWNSLSKLNWHTASIHTWRICFSGARKHQDCVYMLSCKCVLKPLLIHNYRLSWSTDALPNDGQPRSLLVSPFVNHNPLNLLQRGLDLFVLQPTTLEPHALLAWLPFTFTEKIK